MQRKVSLLASVPLRDKPLTPSLSLLKSKFISSFKSIISQCSQHTVFKIKVAFKKRISLSRSARPSLRSTFNDLPNVP